MTIDFVDGVDRDRLAAVCRRYGVASLSMFGSVARGASAPSSDLHARPGRVPGPATRRRRALAGSLVALLAALDDPSSYVGTVVSGTPMSPLAWLLDTVGPLDLEPEELSSDPFYLDQLDNDPGRGPARSAEPGSGMNDPTSPHW